jgi:hypothetical protein
MKTTFKDFINEEYGYSKPYDIYDLAEFVSRLQAGEFEKQIAKEAFIELFKKLLKNKGNYAIKKEFEKATDLEIKPIGPGKFVIVYEK